MSQQPDFSVRGKVVIVTGSARGLGLEFAKSLAAGGAKLVCVDLDQRTVDIAAERINREGGAAIGVGCDISDASAVQPVVEAARAAFGRVDALVNNAGVNQAASALDADVRVWERVISVNIVGSFLMSRAAAVPMIAQRRGSIINITSIHASVAPAFHAASAYAASKAGLLGLTRALAVEWGKDLIRVNALAPGFVNTEMTRQRLDDPEYVRRIEERSPIPKVMQMSDLLGALHFLVCDASAMVTGQTVGVDAGWLAV